MFRTRTRKILGDVLARKGRTALVSIAIFIGVAGTIAFFSLSDIIVRQLAEDIQPEELAMLRSFVSVNSDVTTDDAAYLERLGQIEGLTDVQARIQSEVFYKLDETAEEFDDAVIQSASSPFDQLPLEPLRLLEGNYPQDGQNQVALEQRLAERLELRVGDTLYFRVLSPSRATEQNGAIGTLEGWTISGILFDAYNGSNQSIYANPADANYLSGSSGYSEFSARFVDFPTAEAMQDTFVDLLANETPYRPVFTLANDPANNPQIEGARTIGNTMGTLAIVALVVSGFLVINVISSIVVEQKRQIGVMKSMGATRLDNYLMYAGIAFTYGLIGVVPGVLVGVWGGDAAAKALAPTLGTVLTGFQTSTSSILLGVLVGLLIPVLASILPVFFGTRVKILDAMTDLGIDVNYGSGPLARLIRLLPLPITVRQGLSNVTIKKSRLVFTVITLAIAAGAFMGIFAVFNSLTSGIDLFLGGFNVEVGVIPNQGRPPEEIRTVIAENFQTAENTIIENIEPGFQYQVEFEGFETPPSTGGPPGIIAYGFDVNSATPAFTFTVDEGEELTDANAANGIVLSNVLAALMEKGVGDQVVLKVPGATRALTVVGISEFPLNQVWLDWRVLAEVTNNRAVPQIVSPIELPQEAQAFIRYATNVQVGTGDAAAEAAALGLTQQAADAFGEFITDGTLYTLDAPGVIISSALAESSGYAVGDTITLTSTQAGGTTSENLITGILTLPALMQNDLLPQAFIAAPWETVAQLDGLSLENGPLLPQAYFLTTTLDDPTALELDDTVDRMNEAFLNAGIPSNVINFVQQVEQISQGFVIIQVVLQLVAGLIALVGALGLLTTLSMAVFERQKEIGVMRSIGARSGTIAGQFLTEGMFVGIIAWLAGLPIGIGIQLLLLNVTGFIETFPPTYPVNAAALGLVGMIVITIIASLWPSLSAARKTVSDILRYQ